MTIMTGQGLNATGFNLGKTKKGTLVNESDNNFDGDDSIDLQTITDTHKASRAQEEKNKNAIGLSHNIFDTSSYGEVRLNGVFPAKA